MNRTFLNYSEVSKWNRIDPNVSAIAKVFAFVAGYSEEDWRTRNADAAFDVFYTKAREAISRFQSEVGVVVYGG